jgi:Holliday junction resolvase-like predicted endonuclease
VESVDVYKQRKILAAVKMYFLRNQKYLNLQPQIDVCVLEYSDVDKTFKPAKIIANAVEDWN